MNVGTMVKLLAVGKERNQVLEASTAKAESILFFKNWRRGGVAAWRRREFAGKCRSIQCAPASGRTFQLEEPDRQISLVSKITDSVGRCRCNYPRRSDGEGK